MVKYAHRGEFPLPKPDTKHPRKMSTVYMFGVSTKKITKREAARRDAIARKHGGNFVGPLTAAGNAGRS